MVVSLGNDITKISVLLRVSGRVKENVRPPKKLFTPIAVLRDERIEYD